MELQMVDSYVYLGRLLHNNEKFLQTEKRLSQQGAHVTIPSAVSVDISSMISSIKNRNNKGYSGSTCLTPSKLSNASESTPTALRSTVDAVFIIQGIISNILQNRFKLYSAFVDFRKAFDKLNRKILIYKLLRNGLSTKFVAMVKSIADVVEFRVFFQTKQYHRQIK
jgi:hypothetical protein